jgi:hypothetical protein
MKKTNHILLTMLALAVCTGLAPAARAQVTNIITLKMTIKIQNQEHDNGTNTTAAAPTGVDITTVNLLKEIAQAEYAESKISTNSFPATAKLAAVAYYNGDPSFLVLSSTNTLLCDVSDVLSVRSGQLGLDVFSGTTKDSNSLPNTSATDLHVETVVYDDTGILGTNNGVQFYMTGLMASTRSLKLASGGAAYTLTESNNLSNGVGEGQSQGMPFMLTGSITIGGSVTRSF